MNLAVACCIFLFTFFNFDPHKITLPVLDGSLPFLKSLFYTNNLPTQTKNSPSYTIALVGDSMTESLGTADILRGDLINYYPDKNFGILNFGIGSTSILSVPDRLTKESKRGAETLPPVLKTRPDIILLESFGNNPLSEYSLGEGLKKQTKILDQIVKLVQNSDPKPVLIFVATIAPSKEKYAQGVVDLSSEQREKWAKERIAYMKNHIDYALSHKIPVVNIYQKSLTLAGDGNTEFLNASDFIHPSSEGINFISQQIADAIYNKEIIPH